MKTFNRRQAIKTVAGAAAIVSTTGFTNEAERQHALKLKGNINHSVCKWCYRDYSVAELAAEAVKMGIKSVEIIGPEDFNTVKEYGLVCAMANGPGSIENNVNRVENHERLIPAYKERAGVVADAGFKNLIIFSGNRDGMDDEEGLENCAKAIKEIVLECEKKGVMLIMELLNSKVNRLEHLTIPPLLLKAILCMVMQQPLLKLSSMRP